MLTDDWLRSGSISYARLLLVLAVACYIAMFNLTYRDLVAPTFEFWGLGYHQLSFFQFSTSAMFCIIPAFWMPVRFSRPSLLFFYVQYFLIFIPASFIVYYSVRPEVTSHDALMLVVAMFAGMSVIQVAYLVPARQIRAIRVTPEFFWVVFAAAAGLMLTYLAVTLGGAFRLAKDFQDVYVVRTAMAEALTATGSRFGFYAQSLISTVALPFLFAVGMYLRRWWVALPVAAGYLFLFGIGGAKAAALGIVYLPASFVLLSRKPHRIAFYVAAGLSVLLLAGYLTKALLAPSANIGYLALVHFRFFTVPPLTIPQYFDFFQSHPMTHLSHVTGLNMLMDYPYDLDVPYTVGSYFYTDKVGLNSGFWAADGIAGFGILGVPLVSVFCAIVFWLLDSVSAELDPTFVALVLTYCTVFFGNVSLFTTLITGGLAMLMVIMAVAPRDERGLIRLPSLSYVRKVAVR